MDECNIETPEMTINRLQEENYKLREEVKSLQNDLIDYTNYISHINMTVNLITHKLKRMI
jgi:chaperonin cofactor prefoldin